MACLPCVSTSRCRQTSPERIGLNRESDQEDIMPVALILSGHMKDLGGGFMIRRLLPAAERQAVGPFLFMDHFGPVIQQPGRQLRRAPASAYRAGHRDLSVRRRNGASRQPGNGAAHRAGRDQLDDVRPRYRAFGAQSGGAARGDPAHPWLAALGRPAAGIRGDRTLLRAYPRECDSGRADER